MLEPIETIERSGLIAKIYQDDDAESPDHWDEESTDIFIVTTDNRYFSRKRKGYAIDDIREHLETHKRYNGYVVYPLYAYIHSGTSLSLGNSGYPFNDRWDAGQIGFVLVQWKGNKHHRAMAESLVDTWNMYFSGDVYGVVIEDEQGEMMESCWGFYGSKYAMDEAKRMLEYEMERISKERRSIGGSELQLS